VNDYANACKTLREAIEDYLDAATWELRHKMPPLDAIDLAQATAGKAVDVIAAEKSQQLAGAIVIPDNLAEIFQQNGGVLVARSEARLRTSIWDDDDFLIRPGREQLAYIFFVSQPDISHCGVLSLRLKRWAKKLKYTPELLDGVLTGLSESRFVVVDYDEEELLVRSYLRNDGVLRNFKVLKAAASNLPQVMSKPIRETIANEIERSLHEGLATASTRPVLLGMLGVLGRPSHALSDAPSDTPSDGASDDPSMGHDMTHDMGDANSAGTRGKGLGAGFRSVSTYSSSSDDEASKKAPKKTPAKGTRIPDDFTVSDDLREWCRKKAPLVFADIEYHTEQFIDYWSGRTGQIAVKLDWDKTWQWWMRKANKDAADRNTRQGDPGRRLVDVSAARCKQHPRELADHCTICDSEKRGAA
jgi:hypothetical protein